MQLFTFEGRSPRIHPTAFVAPTATLIGDVTIEAGASVWFGAVLRADDAPIVVREGANVQDGAVLHVPPGVPVDVGPGATVAHMCLIHGAHIGADRTTVHAVHDAVFGEHTQIAADGLSGHLETQRQIGDGDTAAGTDLGDAPETGDARLLVAARIGTTRLIDNVGVPVGIGFRNLGDEPVAATLT